MTQRREVFQSKVLQRLYPAAPKVEKQPSPPHIAQALSKKTYVKRKASSQEDTAAVDTRQAQTAANTPRRMYTVLPPPADYKAQSEKSVTLLHLESINSAEDPAEESVHESNEELDQEEEQEGHKRKRRRRKKKPVLQQDSGPDGAAPGQTPVDEGREQISKNKKRKLKKKRHKEKLLSMGVMPRAAALEFTYQKDGGKEGEEGEEELNNKRRAAEVSDFLKTTLEMYMSDSSLRADKLPLQSGTVDDLLSHISSGCKPNSVLEKLYRLKVFVQQKETNKLEKALKELRNDSCMSAEETAAVILLFQYWITDILPMQRNKTTELSTTHQCDCQSH